MATARRCELLSLPRSSSYYQRKPVPAEDLALINIARQVESDLGSLSDALLESLELIVVRVETGSLLKTIKAGFQAIDTDIKRGGYVVTILCACALLPLDDQIKAHTAAYNCDGYEIRFKITPSAREEARAACVGKMANNMAPTDEAAIMRLQNHLNTILPDQKPLVIDGKRGRNTKQREAVFAALYELGDALAEAPEFREKLAAVVIGRIMGE